MAVKKHGRNKKSTNGKAYIIEGRALKNKKAKIAAHQKEHPNDTQAIGTVPDYTTTKTTGYLFGADAKSVSSTRTKSKHGTNSTVTKNK